MYLLCISGLDDTENREIYETYMHSDHIAYSGKLSIFGTLSNQSTQKLLSTVLLTGELNENIRSINNYGFSDNFFGQYGAC